MANCKLRLMRIADYGRRSRSCYLLVANCPKVKSPGWLTVGFFLVRRVYVDYKSLLIAAGAVRQGWRGVFGAIVLEHPEDPGNSSISHYDSQGQCQKDCYHQKDRHPERDQDRLTQRRCAFAYPGLLRLDSEPFASTLDVRPRRFLVTTPSGSFDAFRCCQLRYVSRVVFHTFRPF